MPAAKKIAVFAGSIDPVTRGHLGIVEVATRLFDEVHVCIAVNAEKTSGMFSYEERQTLAELAFKKFGPRVRVVTWPGLLPDYLKETGAIALIRGLRDGVDLSNEWRLADIYSKISFAKDYQFDILYLRPELENREVSSTIVREMIRYEEWAVVEMLVPQEILPLIIEFRKSRNQ